MDDPKKTVEEAKRKASQSGSQALAKAQTKGTMKGLNSTDIGTVLSGYKSQIEKVIPKHLTAERMIQMATTLIARNPRIAECTASSVVGSVVSASILGFPPVQELGYCYFVPYRRNIGTKSSPNYVKELQFQIGYKGHMELARRSSQIKSIHAEVVREGDEFKYQLGLNPELKHIPDADINAMVTHAYAVAHYKDGGYNFVVLTRNQIEALRLRSPGQSAGKPSDVWATDYDKMAMAKAVKQLSKFLPISIDYHENLIADEKVIHLEDIEEGKIKIENLEGDITDLNDVQTAEEVKDDEPDKEEMELIREAGELFDGQILPKEKGELRKAIETRKKIISEYAKYWPDVVPDISKDSSWFQKETERRKKANESQIKIPVKDDNKDAK